MKEIDTTKKGVKEKDLLNKFVSEVFVNGQEEIIQLLKIHEMEDSLKQILDTLDDVEIDSLSDKAFVSSLSSSFLTIVNTRIAKISSKEEKEQVQYILGELSKQILIQLIQKSNDAPTRVISNITSGLEVACKVNGWNFQELKQTLSFDLLHAVTAKSSQKDLTQEREAKKQVSNNGIIYHYEWNGKEEDLDELAYNLKDKKTLKSTREFKRLFAKHDGELSVRINSAHIDFVVILFDELKTMKLITPKGAKAKQFTPLKAYAVDFENSVLISSEAKHIKYAITKNSVKHARIKKSVAKWISGFELNN